MGEQRKHNSYLYFNNLIKPNKFNTKIKNRIKEFIGYDQNIHETLLIIIDKIDQIEKEFLGLSLVSSMNMYDIDETITLLLNGATVTDSCFDFISHKIIKNKKIELRKLFAKKLLNFCTEKVKTHDSYIYFNYLIESNKFNTGIDVNNEIKKFIGNDPNIYIYKKNLL